MPIYYVFLQSIINPIHFLGSSYFCLNLYIYINKVILYTNKENLKAFMPLRNIDGCNMNNIDTKDLIISCLRPILSY